jgi:hypothetical protein
MAVGGLDVRSWLLDGLTASREAADALPKLEEEQELRTFLDDKFGIRIPNKRVCKHHSTPWRALCDAYFARHRVCVWKGSRGLAGKTFLLSALGLAEALTLRADVVVLGGSGEQSKRVLASMTDAWSYPSAPTEQIKGDLGRKETTFRAGNSITALLASQASVRGPHPQRLRLDEVDEMAWPIFKAAMGQPMTKRGIEAQTVMSSTHQYPNGTMTKVLSMAAERGWPVHEWCWKETVEPHGWLTRREVEAKRNELTEETWRVEVELGEPSAEGRAINDLSLGKLFDQERGEYAGADGEEVRHLQPAKSNGADATFVHGADWARKQDKTCVVSMRTDVRPFEIAAYQRVNKRPWPVLIQILVDRLAHYTGKACHDATGIGDVIDSLLDPEQTWPIIMVGRDRQDLLTEYVAAIERGEIVGPMIRTAQQEHRWLTQEVLYGTEHPPDTVVAGAMAYRAARLASRDNDWRGQIKDYGVGSEPTWRLN